MPSRDEWTKVRVTLEVSVPVAGVEDFRENLTPERVRLGVNVPTGDGRHYISPIVVTAAVEDA